MPSRYLCAGRGGWPMPCPSHFILQKVTWCLLYRRLSGPQGRYELVWKILSPTRVQTPVCPPSSKSLYQLCYTSCPAQLHLYRNSSHLLHISTVTSVYPIVECVAEFVFPVFQRNIVFLLQWETLTERHVVTFQRNWIIKVIGCNENFLWQCMTYSLPCTKEQGFILCVHDFLQVCV